MSGLDVTAAQAQVFHVATHVALVVLPLWLLGVAVFYGWRWLRKGVIGGAWIQGQGLVAITKDCHGDDAWVRPFACWHDEGPAGCWACDPWLVAA